VSDPISGKIVVTDYAGTVTTTLAGLPGVTGLALAADSGHVYAAVKGGDRIVSVDTKTYASDASYDLAGADAPGDLEIVDGRLWFGYAGGLGSLDVSGAAPVVRLGQDGGHLVADPILAADPAAPGVLAAGGGGSLAVFDVSADGAVLRASGSMDPQVDQIDLTPDGKDVLTDWDTTTYGFGIYSTTDAKRVGGYRTDAYPNAVAIAPDGTVAGGSDSSYDPDVHIIRPGDSTPTRVYDFPGTGNSSGGDTLYPGALAWAPDRSRVFAVSENNLGTFSLRALTDPTKEVPTLTVSAPAKADRAKKLTVTGKLTATSALPAGTVVTVTRSDLNSPKGTALPSVKVAANGTFSFSDTPYVGGTDTYKVAYAGSQDIGPATASASVAVSRVAPALTVSQNNTHWAYGKSLTFTAHLGTTTNRTLQIYSDPWGTDQPKKLLKTGTVDSKGNLSVTVKLIRNNSVTAVFSGDALHAPASYQSTAYTAVQIFTSLGGYYKTGTIGSAPYYYVHKNTEPILTTAMPYYPGRQQELQFQVYSQGKWYDTDAEYFPLGTDGKSYVNLGSPGESGVQARVRPAYIHGGSGDTVNDTTYGTWKNLYFTN
jgi:hypothetical protein